MMTSTFSIKTFGCKVNQYEEQVLRERISEMGFSECAWREADCIIINSCTVTKTADRKSLKLIRRIKKSNPEAKIFFTGCLAETQKDLNALKNIKEIDAIVPLKEKLSLPEILFQENAPEEKVLVKNGKEEISSFGDHTRAFLKIQDGCPQNCSYCKVGLIRNEIKSKSLSRILREIELLAGNGYNEIVLTGICLGAWRGDRGTGLQDLVKEINLLEGSFRVRLSSIEPNHLNDDLIEEVANSEKFCNHFHLPLQSGSNKVLASMKRPYTVDFFKDRIERARAIMKKPGISLDIIVGYPTELKEDFKKTCLILDDIAPSRLHVFRYSPREETQAYLLGDKVSSWEKSFRSKELISFGEKMQGDFAKSFVGEEVEVLFENREEKGYFYGYTREYVRVKSKADKVFAPGQLIKTQEFLLDGIGLSLKD